MEATYEERRAHENEVKADYSKRIFEIIHNLGWSLVPDQEESSYPRHKAVNGKTGLTYFFNADQWHKGKIGKVEITAFLDVKTDLGERVYSDERVSICLSLDKSLDLICKDIRRRLVPDAEKILTEMEKKKEARNDRDSAGTKALESAIGRPLTLNEQKEKEVKQGGVKITSNYDGTVNVDIQYLSGQPALAVIKTLIETGQLK